MRYNAMLTFERCLPEDTGIPSACISNFINRLEAHQVPMAQSFIVTSGRAGHRRLLRSLLCHHPAPHVLDQQKFYGCGDRSVS